MKRSDLVEAGRLGGKDAGRNMAELERIDRDKEANAARQAKAKEASHA